MSSVAGPGLDSTQPIISKIFTNVADMIVCIKTRKINVFSFETSSALSRERHTFFFLKEPMLDRQASMDIIILKRRSWVIITFKADTDRRKITLVGMFINWHDETYQIKVDVT